MGCKLDGTKYTIKKKLGEQAKNWKKYYMIIMHGHKLENTDMTKCNTEKKVKNNCMGILIFMNGRKSMKLCFRATT